MGADASTPVELDVKATACRSIEELHSLTSGYGVGVKDVKRLESALKIAVIIAFKKVRRR